IETVQQDAASTPAVRVFAVSGGVNVVSAAPHTLNVYTLNGTLLGAFAVGQGMQTINLPVGTFIVDGVKVIVTE
ncbi:MAG: hypothetical protein WCQ86_07575, partial [Bacteroidaceae bacterium]